MRTSFQIANLHTREPAAWRVIDQFMSDTYRKDIPPAVRMQAASFVLSRIYPAQIEQNTNTQMQIVLIKTDGEKIEAGRIQVNAVPGKLHLQQS